MWDSRPRLSGLLTAEGGCPTFKKKHSLNCSTYFFAIPNFPIIARRAQRTAGSRTKRIPPESMAMTRSHTLGPAIIYESAPVKYVGIDIVGGITGARQHVKPE